MKISDITDKEVERQRDKKEKREIERRMRERKKKISTMNKR